MSLRDELIEAGAEAAYQTALDHLGWKPQAEATLDAFLDVLTERAEDWFRLWTAWEDEDGNPKFIGLLAVLRAAPPSL